MKEHIRIKLIKRIICMILFFTMTGMVTVNAAEGQQEEISGELEIVSNISEDIMQKYLTDFCKKYPEIEIKYQYYVDYEEEVKNRLESGDYGDVLFMPSFIQSSDYARYFAPIGNYEELAKKYNYLERSKYVEQTVYGIPSSAYVAGILYNKDVFYQAGISDTPKSIEAFLQDLRYMKERTNAIPFYTNYAASWPLQFWEYYPYIEMTGNSDYKENLFVNESNPFLEGTTHYQVYKLLYDIVDEGLCEEDPRKSDWEQSKVMLNEGKIGCIAIGSWAISQVKDAGPNSGAIAFMPFPNEISGRQYMTISTDYCYAINKNSKNRAAAKAYIEFMLDESGYALDHETLSVVKTDPYPDSYGNMENVILLSNNPASGEAYQKKLKLSTNLNMEDTTETKRVIEAGCGIRNETFEDIAKDWNSRWEASRTPDMEVSESEVKALLNSVIVSNYEINFSQTEQQYLREKKNLRVGYVKNTAPFQYENELGFTGVSYGICECIAENTGLKLEYCAYDNTAQILEALQNGEIEMASGIDKSTGDKGAIRYSKEYLSYMNVVVRNAAVDMNELKGKRAACIIGESEGYIVAGGTTVVSYATFAEALKAVDEHKEDYIVTNYYSADYYIQEQECTKVSILPLSEMGEMCLAFPDAVDTRLVSICNKCIYGIPEGNIQVMLREYMEQPAKPVTLRRFIETNPITCIFALSGVFLFIVAAIIAVMHEKDKSAKKHEMDVKRYEMLASIVNEYIFEYDLKTHTFHFDSKLQEKFGLDKNVDVQNYKGENDKVKRAIPFFENIEKAGNGISEAFLLSDSQGEKQWYKLVSHTVCDRHDEPQHIIGKLVNVQKEMEEMQQMEDKAFRDPLTGLFNRDGFQSRLDEIYAKINENLPITVAVLDFDNFKSVNDILGHAGGDAALQLLAEKLKEVFGEQAVISRYGGDEFMMCIFKIQEAQVREKLERLVHEMDREFIYQAVSRKISISLGAVYVQKNVPFQILFKEADKMLYQTKNKGRNGYHLIHHMDEV